ncbi:PTS system, fructose-specific IIA component [Alkalibacterium gilvum]|uniref:PTS system, fructose-specific IIA component n=1 Tax=Alkalibacterium gilvum TaxID=1130080 RepID=A0A1H6VAI8_9LACT|nr:PTS sugar transporter subunit IIA [Alkalibacterium gilvum]SEJ00826.1 PTS system, fructose-specific IIA component [Alkalibacterium gilvum]
MQNEKVSIEKDNILFDLDVKDYREVISTLSDLLYENHVINSKEEFNNAVIERENDISTSIGNELAIPHGKSESVLHSSIALAVLKNKIKWGGEGNDEVKYVFMLAIEDRDKGNKHLQVLANLSSHLMDDDFVKEFKKAESKDQLFKIVNKIN